MLRLIWSLLTRALTIPTFPAIPGTREVNLELELEAPGVIADLPYGDSRRAVASDSHELLAS